MANPSIDALPLQLAMAFGQGAGTMLAAPEALTFALSSNTALIRRARADWTASRFAFIELVRRLGQISAGLAVADGSAEIELKHIRRGLPIVLGICPCGVPFKTRRPRKS